MTASAKPSPSPSPRVAPGRVPWVDYAKGWSIVLVVSMHSALGVGVALDETGWLHPLVAFAKPFRMPDFFLVAGLFLGRAIAAPWRDFLDRKVLHFVYFFALWTFIMLAAKGAGFGLRDPLGMASAFLRALVDPFSSLWFVQLLPLLFIAARLARDLPALVSLGAAVALHLAAAFFPDGGRYAMGSNMTGWMTLDSFCLFYVYFLIGHLARDAIFAFAQQVERRRGAALGGLVLWALAQQGAVTFGLAEIPGLTLVFGLAGALAVVAVAALMASWGVAGWLAYCGRKSLPIYLSFALPMAASRILLIRSGAVADPGLASLLVTACALATPLALEAVTRTGWLSFLFVRPNWAHLPAWSAVVLRRGAPAP